jgi:enoyl-CoA hydratase
MEEYMAYENFIFEKEGSIGIIRMNRPDALNALNSATFHEYDKLLDELERDEDIRVVIITGEGKAFVAGADIVEMKDMSGEESRAFSALGQKIFRRFETMNKVFIAAVNGFALGGGCELAMACDIRIASEKAKFGQPEVNLGVTPGFAGTARLPRLVGPAKAKELLFSGDMIRADEAVRIGLANRVVPPESLMEEVKKLAATILSKGPLAIKMVKDCVNRGMQTDIDKAGDIEVEAFGKCFQSGETREGMTAFLDKREPKF